MARSTRKNPPSFTVRPSESAVARVNRAVMALRQGAPVIITDGHSKAFMLAVETLSEPALADVKADAALILTHSRARTLKIRLYTPDVVAIPIDADTTVHRLRAIADPTFDLIEPLKGPFLPLRAEIPATYAGSVKLTKLAGLVPATVIRRTDNVRAGVVTVSLNDIVTYDRESVETLELVTRAHVPLAGAEKTELAAFRARDGGPEHFAIIINAPSPGAPVLTRLHSECFTGDLLQSLRCDCGAQLRGAVEAISQAGGGIILYLAQEGRGIGLANKLRAYRLQDQGFDTMEANERLGFDADERLYMIGAKMLLLLGYRSVRLLTNNPSKVEALKAAGIAVTERVPHRFPDNPRNREYLERKAKAGHLL